MNQESRGIKLGRIIAQSQADEGLRKRLLADPIAALKSEGIEIPAGLTLKVFENTEKVFHLVLPAGHGKELSDSDLDKVSAAGDADAMTYANLQMVEADTRLQVTAGIPKNASSAIKEAGGDIKKTAG